MKLFMLTLKYFLQLKWAEIAKDEAPEWSKTVLVISLEVGLVILVNMPFVIWVSYKRIFIEGVVCLYLSALALTLAELLLVVLLLLVLHPLFVWLKNNWKQASRMARNKLKPS